MIDLRQCMAIAVAVVMVGFLVFAFAVAYADERAHRREHERARLRRLAADYDELAEARWDQRLAAGKGGEGE